VLSNCIYQAVYADAPPPRWVNNLANNQQRTTWRIAMM